MAERRCSIDGCGGRHKARGWCDRHYQRWKAHGDPEHVERVRVNGDAFTRFAAKVDKAGPDGCWLWTASLSDDGYGQFSIDGEKVWAHRWSYEHHVGPIPDDLQIDHLCRVRHCVNPTHLEPVTLVENVMRGVSEPAVRARRRAERESVSCA